MAGLDDLRGHLNNSVILRCCEEKLRKLSLPILERQWLCEDSQQDSDVCHIIFWKQKIMTFICESSIFHLEKDSRSDQEIKSNIYLI